MEKNYDELPIEYMKPDSARYNEIPIEYLQGEKKILEIGCGNGANQIGSIHHRFFEENAELGNYTGVDLGFYRYKYLKNIVHDDIRTMELSSKYDVVLAIHVLEHIPIEDWSGIAETLIGCLKPDGVLLVGTPLKETEEFAISPYHVVLGIDEEMLLKYFPNMIFKRFRYIIAFHQDGKSIIYSFLRYLKRRLLRNRLLWSEKHYRVLGILRIDKQ